LPRNINSKNSQFYLYQKVCRK